MKKYFLAITALSLILLAGCANDPSQNPYLEDHTEESSGRGSIEAVPSPETPPLSTEEYEPEPITPPPVAPNTTETQITQESKVIEKNGLKIEGNVDADFKVNSIAQGLKTIAITADGFQPDQVEMKVGDKVTFVNMDSETHQPASDPHPSHTICKGFDSLKSLGKNEKYEYTILEAKSCPFHDHLNPSFRGSIIVK